MFRQLRIVNYELRNDDYDLSITNVSADKGLVIASAAWQSIFNYELAMTNYEWLGGYRLIIASATWQSIFNYELAITNGWADTDLSLRAQRGNLINDKLEITNYEWLGG